MEEISTEGCVGGSCRVVCEDHEAFYHRLGDIALRNAAFEQEMLSHLSALREISLCEGSERDKRAIMILDKLEVIEKKVADVTNGGLKEAMIDLVPILLQNVGLMKTENTKGRWNLLTAVISGVFAVGGALIGWLIAVR